MFGINGEHNVLTVFFSFILFFRPPNWQYCNKPQKQRNITGTHEDFRMKFNSYSYSIPSCSTSLNSIQPYKFNTIFLTGVSLYFVWFVLAILLPLSIQLSMLFFRLMKIHVLWLSRQKSCSSHWSRTLCLNLYRSLCPDS